MDVVHEWARLQPDDPAEAWPESWAELEQDGELDRRSPTPVLTMHDPTGRVLYVTVSARDLFDVDDEAELLGRDLIDLIHPDDREAMRRAFCGWLSGRFATVARFRVPHDDGTWCAMEAHGSRERATGGIPTVIVTARPCTWDAPPGGGDHPTRSQRSVTRCACGVTGARSRRTPRR